MAAAPTLITNARRQVVDFTVPFLTTQATLLLRRPPPGAQLIVKDLADLVAQSEIMYGTLRKGFIPRNFRSTNDTLLTIIWRNMRRSAIYRRLQSDNRYSFAVVRQHEMHALWTIARG